MEYIYFTIFLFSFTFIILWIDNFQFYTTLAFLLGAIKSLITEYTGMNVATNTNGKVTFMVAKYRDEELC